MVCLVGFSFGILSSLDVLGLDVLSHVYEHLNEVRPALNCDYDISAIRGLVDQGCFGKINASGFFNYDSNGKKLLLNAIALNLIHNMNHNQPRANCDESVKKDRILLTAVNEAFRCLDDDVSVTELNRCVVTVLLN